LVRTEAELVLHNGSFFTVDERQPRARAGAIVGGRFVAVGSDDEVLNLASAATKKIDLGGRTVLPGFIDAHSHPASAGYAHLKKVDCDLRSIDAIVKALAAKAAKTKPGDWVLGFKYDDTKTAEGRPLRREDLDGGSTAPPGLAEHPGGAPPHAKNQGY